MPTDRSPACSCASSVLRDSTAQGCWGHRMGSSPRLLQLLTGTQHLARAALRGSAMCCCGAIVFLDAASPQRGWLICASVLHSPSEQCLCVLAADGPSPGQPRQQEQELSFRLSAQTLPLQPREPCTYLLHWPLPHTQCSLPLAPGHTGRPARRPDSVVRRRAAVHAALCTAQAALNSTSIPSGTKTVSAATACQAARVRIHSRTHLPQRSCSTLLGVS